MSKHLYVTEAGVERVAAGRENTIWGGEQKNSIHKWFYIKIKFNFKVEIQMPWSIYPIKLLIEIPGIPT